MIKRPKPPLNILVVEDEPLIAMDMEMMVEDAGHHVIGEATSLYDAQKWNDDLDPRLALVDVQLARQTSGLDVSNVNTKALAQYHHCFCYGKS